MIVIPARNEGPRIGSVLRRLRATLPRVPVLVVVNGSSDDTASVAEAEGAEVIASDPGYATALVAGYREVSSRWGERAPQGAWVAQLDADGQHPPEAIPLMVAALSRAHLTVGSRWAGRRGPPWMGRERRLGIGVLAAWSRVRAGLEIRDVTSGFQALRAEVLPSLLSGLEAGRVDADLLVGLDRGGFVLSELPVQMAPRQGGDSQHRGLEAVRYSLGVLRRIHEQAGHPRARRRTLDPWLPLPTEGTDPSPGAG